MGSEFGTSFPMKHATQWVDTVEVYLEHEDVNNEAEESESGPQGGQSDQGNGESGPQDGAESEIEMNKARENVEPDPRDERVAAIVGEFVDEE